MPYINDWSHSGLHRTFFGCVTGEEILQANLILQKDQRFILANYVINDFSQVTEYSISLSDAEILAKADGVIADVKGPLNIAIIVASEKQRLLAQAYLDLMDGSVYSCRIFDNISDSYEWLES